MTLTFRKTRGVFSKIALSLIFSLTFSVSIFGQNQKEVGRPFITNYPPNLHDANPQNWTIQQDDRGIMYFGNSDGILEYDGHNWRLIKTPKNNVVRSLTKDENGRIWVGGSGEVGYLAPDEKGKMGFVSLTTKIPEKSQNFNDVWGTSIAEDGVYFSAFRHNFLWNGEKMQVVEQDSGSFIGYFAIDKRLFRAARGLGFQERIGAEFKTYDGTIEIRTQEGLSDFVPYDDESMLILTRSRNLYKSSLNSTEQFQLSDWGIVRQQTPRRILVLPSKNLVIATLRGGVFILNSEGKILNHYEKANGLQDNVVYELFLDRNNAIWLAHDNGISQIPLGSQLTYFDENLGLTSNVMSFERHNGTLYIGTTEGGSYLDRKTGLFTPLKNIGFQCFDMLKVGEALYTASQNGFQKVVGDRVIDLNDTVNTFSALALHQSKKHPEFIFVGTPNGAGLMRDLGNNKFDWVGDDRIGEILDGIWDFAEDSQGRIWMGAENDGAIRVTFNAWPDVKDIKVERFGSEHGLPKGQVYMSTVEDEIFFHPVKGLYVFDEATQRFSKSDLFGEQAKDQNIGIFSNARNDVYVMNYKGVASATKHQDGNYVLNTAPFKPFSNATMVNVFAEDDGITWFASSAGLIRYDANMEMDYDTKFNTLIRRVTLNEDSVIYSGSQDESKNYRLEYDFNNITFDYVAPFYVREGMTTYKTWLEGYDKSWSGWSTRLEKGYTNLKEGDYTFHVIAKNIYEVEGKEAVVEFTIQPPMHRTVYAYILYVLMGGLLVWLIVRYRTGQLKAQHKVLEDTVNNRTKELSQRVEELAVINSVQQGLVAEMDLQGIYNLVGKKIQEIFDAQIVSIVSFDIDQHLEKFHYVYEDGRQHHPEPRPIDTLRQFIIDSKKRFVSNEPNDKPLRDIGIPADHKPVPGTIYPKSMVFMPMIVGEQVKGYISLQNIDRTFAFSESDISLLATLTNSMSVALENARLFNETQQRATEMASVTKVSNALASQLDLDALIQLVGDLMKEVFDANIVYLAFHDKETDMINFPYQY